MKNLYSSIISLLCGTLFGIALSKGRASDFDTIQNMFLLRDFQLYGVIAVGSGLVMLLLYCVRKFQLRTISGEPIHIVQKLCNRGTFWGSVIFGIGWSLTGGCPGTFLVMLGEGKALALATIAGILVGTWAEGYFFES